MKNNKAIVSNSFKTSSKGEIAMKNKIKNFIKEAFHETKFGVRLLVIIIVAFYLGLGIGSGVKFVLTRCFAASGYKKTIVLGTYDNLDIDGEDICLVNGKIYNLKKYIKKGDTFKAGQKVTSRFGGITANTDNTPSANVTVNINFDHNRFRSPGVYEDTVRLRTVKHGIITLKVKFKTCSE